MISKNSSNGCQLLTALNTKKAIDTITKGYIYYKK